MADYSVTQTYFLNKDPAAANYSSFVLTCKAARNLAPGTSCLRSLSPLCKTSSLQVVQELSQQKMGPKAKDGGLLEQHVLNTFVRIPCQNKPRSTGSLNRTNSPLFSGMRYTGYEQLLTPLALGTHYNRIKYTRPLHHTPNQGQQCSTPQGIKSQPPYKPKAFAWKRRKKAN